jgi:energy-coupling factor transporter ATP-binding protein EcfA2
VTMTGSRNPGRYNIHRLGWSAFEDLCIQVMREVLGETCTRFRRGPDGGRDGWFEGTATARLASQNQLSGKFVVQCKHTSLPHKPLAVADLKKEVAKLTTHAKAARCHYILMTNRQVSAQSEAEMRVTFEAISGVSTFLLLAESWIEDTVDAHPRLLRLVPRLYGIGDLSQILSFSVQQQTAAVLEDLRHPLRTFVATESYRRSELALHKQGFVVLVGPPASGKSAIAANLCMVNIAQDANVRVLRIEHADQFKGTWSPADAHTIYWVDDVFGETTLDDGRVREWSAALEKLEAARRREVRIIFCTRDYILAAAQWKLKKSKADFLNDARVRVDVTSLTQEERDAILYNHIKDGDISRAQKQVLKGNLSAVARLPSFSPELARRLGSQRFHRGINYGWKELQDFFEQPVQHLRDVIHGLSGSETAALAVCLLSGNAVPDPVPDDALADAVLKTYNVTMQQVREALESLEGSLVKRVRQATVQTWQVHHPSMIEALQEELASKSSQLILYLQSARLLAILRDTTTLPAAADSRLVFLPASVYSHVSDRFAAADKRETEPIAQYLVTRASDELLRTIDARCPALLDRGLGLGPEPEGLDVAPNLAVRLEVVGLLGEPRRVIVEGALATSVRETGWLGFLDIDKCGKILPGFVDSLLAQENEAGFPSLETLYYWYAQDLSDKDHVDSAIDGLEANATRLRSALADAGLASAQSEITLAGTEQELSGRLAERRTKIEEDEDRRADYTQDEWKERRYEAHYELQHSRFADVDE